MRDRRHIPALDGIRGAALLAILAYHAKSSWLPGAPLSVTVFFTLSGFLITSLLLREMETTGRLDLRSFWLRRARRLVPGSIATVALVAVLVAAGARAVTSGLVGDAVAALTWTANWHFIADGSTYENLFADPSPFQHFWSLAIEEQVYIVLPLLAMLLLGRDGRHRVRFGVVVALGIAASTWSVVSLLDSSGAGGIAYYATHARVAEPLVGVLLALVLTRWDGFVRFSRGWTVTVDVLGWLSIGGLGVLLTQLSVDDPRLYRGGFFLAAVLAAVVVLASTQPATTVGRVLSFGPLAALGAISYAVYLFHWPIFQWLDPDARSTPQIIAVEVAITIALAAVSTALLEQPIRRRRTRTARVFTAGWANATVTAVAVMTLAVALATPGNGIDGRVAVDLGAGVDDTVPPPPVVAAPATSTVSATGDGAPGQQVPVGAPGDAAPGAPTDEPPAEPITPEERDMLTGGDDWSQHGMQSPPPEDDRLRVAVVGDSLAHNLATGLIRWAESRTDVVVYDLSVSFCPLSRGGERRWEGNESFEVNARCGWWADRWSDRSSNYAAFRPDVVVSSAPFSEMLDRRLPGWGEWRRPGEREYHQWLFEEYRAMYDALRLMSSSETRFLTLNAPCGDWDRPRGWRRVSDPDERMVAMNRGFYPLLVESAQGDLFSELCPNGEYSDDLWGIEDARPDGIHLSDEAAAELARRWLGPLVLQAAGVGGGPLLGPPPPEDPSTTTTTTPPPSTPPTTAPTAAP